MENNNKAYKLYFDYINVRLDSEGDIEYGCRNACMYIAEYEWDEESETVGKFIRRVDALYKRHEEEFPMDISVEEMESMECLNDVFDNPYEAIEAFDEYLDEYKIWRTIYGGYYDPDEYVCEGLEDRDEIYYRTLAWKAVQEKKAQEA